MRKPVHLRHLLKSRLPGLLPALLLMAWLASAVAAESDGELRDENEFGRLLAGGDHVMLMRHALAPGAGDPASFRPGDCSTQRNLSAAGRAQAIRAGERIRAFGASEVDVCSSRWCRARDTADLLAIGKVTPLPLLDSFFRDASVAEVRARQTLEWLRQRPPGRSVLLVTHQVNITALTGVFPASGEMLVLRLEGDALRLLGRIPVR